MAGIVPPDLVLRVIGCCHHPCGNTGPVLRLMQNNEVGRNREPPGLNFFQPRLQPKVSVDCTQAVSPHQTRASSANADACLEVLVITKSVEPEPDIRAAWTPG